MAIGTVDPERASHQHSDFVDLLRDLGANVTPVPFVHGAYDSVFAKDNAVLVSDGRRRALLAKPKHAVRRGEQTARERALRSLGYETTRSDRPFEGGDVVMLPGGEAFVGHGFRTQPEAVRPLGEFLGADVVALELVDARLYHLDTALTVLDDGTALVCKPAFTRDALAKLHRHEAITRILDVPLAEALSFGANAIQVGDAVVLGGAAPRTASSLRSLGFDVHVPKLDQFRLAGGSAACLVSRVHSLDASSPAVTTAA